MNLLKSEWRKLIYARASWGLLLASIFISVLSTVVTPFIIDSQAELFGFGLDSSEAIDSVYANGISGYLFAIILGILLMAGEFRHGTAVATFLAAPKRGAVLAAKLTIAAMSGVLLMVISVGLSLLGGWVALQTFENVAEPSEGIFVNALVSASVSGLVLGVIGVALGTLIRNQMIAIVGTLIYFMIVDPILLALFPDAGKWLPSGLVTAMLSIDVQAAELGIDTSAYLPPITAIFVLLGYGATFGAIAIATSLRRDVE